MCVSALHRVVEGDAESVTAEDIDGNPHRVSLLALDGPPPRAGEWLVVHSGYAIERMTDDQASAVITELRRGATGVSGSDGERAQHSAGTGAESRWS